MVRHWNGLIGYLVQPRRIIPLIVILRRILLRLSDFVVSDPQRNQFGFFTSYHLLLVAW
jgi:hypothetical protein